MSEAYLKSLIEPIILERAIRQIILDDIVCIGVY
jgi:hypothetical protein